MMSNAVIQIIPLHFMWSFAMGGIVTWLVHNVELRARHPVEVLFVIFVIIEVCFLIMVPILLPGVIVRVGIARMAVANLLACIAKSQ